MNPNKVHLALKLVNKVKAALAMKYRESLEGLISEDNWSLFELLLNGEEEEVYEKYGEVLNAIETASTVPYHLFKQSKYLANCIVENGWITERE